MIPIEFRPEDQDWRDITLRRDPPQYGWWWVCDSDIGGSKMMNGDVYDDDSVDKVMQIYNVRDCK